MSEETYSHLSEAQRERLKEIEALRGCLEGLVTSEEITPTEAGALHLERETILLYERIGEYRGLPYEIPDQFSKKAIALRTIIKKIEKALLWARKLPSGKVGFFQDFWNEFSITFYREIAQDAANMIVWGMAILYEFNQEHRTRHLSQGELEAINRSISIALSAAADLGVQLQVYQDKLDQLGWVDPYQ